MTITRTHARRWLGLILLASLAGCAQAYRSYPCGVHYGYCPDPPLPYTRYFGCPTPVASNYPPPSSPLPPPAP